MALVVTFILGLLVGAGYARLRSDRRQVGKAFETGDDPHISRLDVFELPESMRPPTMDNPRKVKAKKK